MLSNFLTEKSEICDQFQLTDVFFSITEMHIMALVQALWEY